jgi:hypothetical protein
MDAFAKSDDERDFYVDTWEGFMVYVDLDASEEDLEALMEELEGNPERYRLIPKLTFYETKKIMEGFINEKVYDIDTKEKLMDIIQSKEARENFLEFIYDHHSELEKWQQYYQERSRIRIIEWLRANEFVFVFEEDLDLTKNVIEKLKMNLFESSVPKDVSNARKVLQSKAKTYYSSEALNPRPKRGRPPKQTQKVEVEPQVTLDRFLSVPRCVRTFLFTPDISHASAVTFSAKFDSKEELMASLKNQGPSEHERTLDNLNQRLASLRTLSRKIMGDEERPLAAAVEPSDSDQTSVGLEPERTEEPASPIKKKPGTPAKIRSKKPLVGKKEAESNEAKATRARSSKSKSESASDSKPRAKRRIIPKKTSD